METTQKEKKREKKGFERRPPESIGAKFEGGSLEIYEGTFDELQHGVITCIYSYIVAGGNRGYRCRSLRTRQDFALKPQEVQKHTITH